MNQRFHYNQKDSRTCIQELIGTKKPKVIFITGDIAKLGLYDCGDGSKKINKSETLQQFYEAFTHVLPDVTVVVPTLTLTLCNTDIPFERNTYTNMGSFSNHVLEMKGSVRSSHPFTSYTAIGPLAQEICTNNTRFSYGLHCPYDKMMNLENEVLAFSVSMEPNLTCSIVHHAEFMAHVPYRYIKEFNHPILQEDGTINKEKHYLHVLYRDMDVHRNKNIKAFENYQAKGGYVHSFPLGRNKVYMYNLNQFYFNTLSLYIQDPYAWMNHEPSHKPYIQ